MRPTNLPSGLVVSSMNVQVHRRYIHNQMYPLHACMSLSSHCPIAHIVHTILSKGTLAPLLPWWTFIPPFAMASSPLTYIPTTQPSCGPITLASPRPQCNSSPAEPMGCFVQRTGFFCAPLRTTRGFLHTLDNATATPATNTPPTLLTRLSMIPRFSFVSSPNTPQGGNNNSSYPDSATLPSLGIDSQPIKTQGPARLGQSCVGIPTPPQTDPLWTVLVTMANRRLEEILKGASPGIGAGADVFSRRGDCESGSYCDFSQAAGGGGEGESERVGVCKEQLPDYHECTSYFECLSLQCGNMDSHWAASKAGSSNLHLTKPGKEKHHRALAAAVAEEGHFWRPKSRFDRRNVVNVCMPARRDSGANGPGHVHGGGGGAGGRLAGKSVFPAWRAALIAVLVLAAATLVFVLVRRRKRLQAQKELEEQQRQQQLLLLQKARSMGEGWDRSRTKSGDFCWKGHDAEKAGAQDVKDVDTKTKGGSWFHKWFVGGHSNKQRSEDRCKHRKAGEASVSSIPGSSSSSQTVASIPQLPSSECVLELEGPERAVDDSADHGIDVESTSASSTVVSGSSSPPETVMIPFEARSESAPGFTRPTDLPESSSNMLRVSASNVLSTRLYPTMTVPGSLSPSPASSSPRRGSVFVSKLGSGISSVFSTRSHRSSGSKVVSISPISPISTGTEVSSRLSSRNSHQAGTAIKQEGP